MDGYESGLRPWPVSWSAIWIGALSALALGLIIGLVGFAIGAHEVTRAASFKSMRITSLIFSVGGAFFAFVLGGWVAARIAGFRRAEPAMLHGSLTWLLNIPMMLALGAFGAARFFGGWYGGFVLAPSPATVDAATAAAMRNSALGVLLALLIGLIGSVIGGWMASGEPMSLTYYRRRDLRIDDRPRRVA